VTSAYGRVSMHGVREALLDAQVAQLGLPCHKLGIPAPCPSDVYEREMGQLLAAAKRDGITHVVFGDLFLEDLRAHREAKLASVGMHAVFPLWKRDTTTLAREMLASGLSARLTCVDPRVLDRSFAGRKFDEALLRDLPSTVDPCGENGEFHSFVTAGPMFSREIAVNLGEIVDREGFVFADLLPA
jgi:uncharacterized protein (TIGR00290 family)